MQKPWRTLATFGELVRQGFVFKLRGEMGTRQDFAPAPARRKGEKLSFKDAAKDSKPAARGGVLLRFSW